MGLLSGLKNALNPKNQIAALSNPKQALQTTVASMKDPIGTLKNPIETTGIILGNPGLAITARQQATAAAQPTTVATNANAQTQSLPQTGVLLANGTQYAPTNPIVGGQVLGGSGSQIVGAGNPNVPPTGLIGSESALNMGATAANNFMNAGANNALAAYNNNPASALQANLAGANGREAQQTAYNNFMQSPGQQYLLDQSQRAIEHSAAAKGNLLGGNVLGQLQQNAIGLAAQDYQNQFNNLNSVANQRNDINSQIANIHQTLGLNQANLSTGLSSQLSSGRLAAGNAIANNAAQAGTQLAQLLSNQGIQVSDAMNKDIGNIANIIYNSGMQDKVDMQNLAQILGNISGGQASMLNTGYTNLGAANAAGATGVGNAIQNGINNYVAYASKPQAVA